MSLRWSCTLLASGSRPFGVHEAEDIASFLPGLNLTTEAGPRLPSMLTTKSDLILGTPWVVHGPDRDCASGHSCGALTHASRDMMMCNAR